MQKVANPALSTGPPPRFAAREPPEGLLNAEDYFDPVQFNSNLAFNIPGDTALVVSWDGTYMVEKAEAYPYHVSPFKAGTDYDGRVEKTVGGSPDNLAGGQTARLIKRENGWTGSDAGGATALKPIAGSGRAHGWFVHLDPGALLHTHPGARGLRILDVRGRVRWETRSLSEGAPVALPQGLPQGALRYQWM